MSEWSGFHKRGLVSHSDIQSYIERIEQRLAEAEAKIPRWIPVGQLLPQKNEFVLFIDGKDTLGGCEKVYVDKIVDSGRGRDCLKNYLHNYTHWMPLPEVPESGSEG